MTAFEETGFVIFPGVIAPEEREILKTEADSLGQ